jgi:hypothetical protein
MTEHVSAENNVADVHELWLPCGCLSSFKLKGNM